MIIITNALIRLPLDRVLSFLYQWSSASILHELSHMILGHTGNRWYSNKKASPFFTGINIQRHVAACVLYCHLFVT